MCNVGVSLKRESLSNKLLCQLNPIKELIEDMEIYICVLYLLHINNIILNIQHLREKEFTTFFRLVYPMRGFKALEHCIIFKVGSGSCLCQENFLNNIRKRRVPAFHLRSKSKLFHYRINGTRLNICFTFITIPSRMSTLYVYASSKQTITKQKYFVKCIKNTMAFS